jgi:cytochrome c peroxidase
MSLSTQDKADLIAFLKTLTDDDLLTHPAYANPFATSAASAASTSSATGAHRASR